MDNLSASDEHAQPPPALTQPQQAVPTTRSPSLSERIAAITVSRRITTFTGFYLLIVGLIYGIFLADQQLLACSVVCLTVGGLFTAPDFLEKSGAVTFIGKCGAFVMVLLASRDTDKERTATRRKCADKTSTRAAKGVLLSLLVALIGLLIIVCAHDHRSVIGDVVIFVGYLFASVAALLWYFARISAAVLDAMQDIDSDYKYLRAELDRITIDRLAAWALFLILAGAGLALAAAATPSSPSLPLSSLQSGSQASSSQASKKSH